MLADLRFALRLFARHPGMTAIAVLSLALATGPNAALFSVIDNLFIEPLSVSGADRLIAVIAAKNGEGRSLSFPEYADISRESASFSEVIAWMRTARPFSFQGREEICPSNAVSPNYFSGLGVKPAAGRLFSPERDAKPDGEPPIVISHSYWKRRFGGRPDIAGQVVLTGNRTAVIAGVAAEGFRGMDFHMPVDVWVPFSAVEALGIRRRAQMENRERGEFETVLGRLRPGVSLEQARAEMSAIGRRIGNGQTYLANSFMRERAAKGLILGGIVLGLVSLVLMIACANVAGLLLAQAEARSREIAVRLSLGAGRARLVRQFLTESVLLALMGAAGGLLLGFWLMRLPLQPPFGISLDYGVRLDWRTYAYSILLSCLSAIVFGLVPALKSSRRDLASGMRTDTGVPPRSRGIFRNVLVVGQIAVSQFLLAGAALWVRSYANVQSIHPGFDPNRSVLFAQLTPAGARTVSYRDMIERVRAVPGVVEVSGAASIPLSGSGGGRREKVLLPGAAEPTDVRNNFVAPRWFAVMGTRLLRGRDFDARDGARAAIVNQALAERIAPGGAVVGRSIKVGGEQREIVGVVEDGKYIHLREPVQPYLYLPQNEPGMLAIATAGYTAGLPDAVRRAVEGSGLRVQNFTTLEQNMHLATWIDRIAMGLFGALGMLGMFLAAVGLYGVLAQSVQRRTHEIGIRVALGAQRSGILAMILGHGAKLALVGIPIGIGAAMAGAAVASNLLYGISPMDPMSYATAAAAVFAIALLATHVPARRATRVDPAVALRGD